MYESHHLFGGVQKHARRLEVVSGGYHTKCSGTMCNQIFAPGIGYHIYLPDCNLSLIQMTKGKSLRKRSLYGARVASVLLKLFISEKNINTMDRSHVTTVWMLFVTRNILNIDLYIVYNAAVDVRYPFETYIG